jgi:asparagine synthase (glutamine-hydrolysing)
MLDAIPHRTVDGAWVRLWPAAGVGLGFGKLTITPEEVDEQQPLISSRSGCVVIADARLDNRAELLQRLPQHHASSSTSDAELILLAYETWGVHSPKHLLGDFAFIVWDPREQHLVMARDTSGQRSLFYRDDGRTFVAASELHQLLQDPAIPIVPNDNRIRDFLVPVNVYRNSKEQDETFYRGLLTVPAGHVMVVTRTGTSRSRYWDMDPRRELRYRRDQDYAEHFRALFLQVVQDRLRSSFPIGATLSGGLDSSSIVSAAQEIYSSGRADNRGFGTFSVVYDDLDCDERPLIEATRARYNLTATYVPRAEVAGLLRLQPRYFAEEPQANSPEAGFPLIRAVFDSGARLLLTGDVADAYVGGSRLVFDSQLRQGHFRQFWNDFRVFRRIADESLHRTVIRSCLGPLLPLGMQKQLNLTHVRRFLSQNWDRLVPTWMTDDLQDDLRQRHLAISIQMEQSRKFSNPAREDSFQMLYPPLVARDYLGWPVELSRPYADRRLHEFMLSIPPEQHFRPHPATDQFYAGSKRLVDGQNRLRQRFRGRYLAELVNLSDGIRAAGTVPPRRAWLPRPCAVLDSTPAAARRCTRRRLRVLDPRVGIGNLATRFVAGAWRAGFSSRALADPDVRFFNSNFHGGRGHPCYLLTPTIFPGFTLDRQPTDVPLGVVQRRGSAGHEESCGSHCARQHLVKQRTDIS